MPAPVETDDVGLETVTQPWLGDAATVLEQAHEDIELVAQLGIERLRLHRDDAGHEQARPGAGTAGTPEATSRPSATLRVGATLRGVA